MSPFLSQTLLRAVRVGPVEVEALSPGSIDALVGMGAEIVALGLKQVGRQALGAITVVISERAHEGRAGNTRSRRERGFADGLEQIVLHNRNGV